MYTRLIGHQTRLAPTLALAALILFTAVQLLEAGHSHAHQDAADHCLVCKSSSDPVAVQGSKAEGPTCPGAAPVVEGFLVAPQSAPAHHLARGPPRYA